MNLSGSVAQNLMCVIIFVLSFLLAQILARKFRIKRGIASGLFLWHSAFAFAYWVYTFSSPADSIKYYKDSFLALPGFRPGTAVIYYVIKPFTNILDVSYLGLFLIFNIAGLIGIYAIYAALKTVTAGAPRSSLYAALAVVILPGINFWSVAPGKDSLFLMAVGLAMWSLVSLPIRKGVLGVSIFIMFLIRPHVAAVFIISTFFASLTTSQLGLIKKLIVIAVLAPLSVVVIQYTLFFVGTELTEIGSYVERRQGYNQSGGGAISLQSMSPPERMFAYLLRPFFDNFGLATLLITGEHIVILFILMRGGINWRKVPSSLPVFTRRLFLLASLIMWVMFANTTANLGIALRQKWMFLPMLLVLAISYWPRKVR